MVSIDSLPADQRAVLELVLRRGRSYDEIAELLAIDRAGVRQRALAAFDALGPRTRVAPNRRALITDYLLDALPGGVAEEVRDHLLGSASERAWAQAVASEIQGLTDHPLPEIPSNGRRPRAKAADGKSARRGEVGAATKSAGEATPAAEVPVAAALSNGSPRERRPSSRLGGTVLLAVVAAVAIAVVLVFVVFTGGSAPKHHATAAHRSTARASTTGASSSPKLLAQLTLAPPRGGRSPVGLAYVISVRKQVGILIGAQGLTPNRKHPPNYYALWLYNSAADSRFMGFVTPAVGKNGQFRLAVPLPKNASHYRTLLVTLETKASPKTPGHIVLQGTRSAGL